MDEAIIEDLAFEVRPSREIEEVNRPRCLSTRQDKDIDHVMEREYTVYVMSCNAEFRGRREGRMENGVKNLIGSEAILKNTFYQ